MTPPWGVPETVSVTTPSANTPAASHPRRSFSTRRSDTRSPTSDKSLSWSIVPKKFSMSASKTKWLPSMKPTRSFSIASSADRFGRNPKEQERKSASKIGSRTSLVACWAIRSFTVGMPNGRVRPSGFGISTLRTGAGW